MSHVFVIAEAGISHDGDLRKALTLIDAAKEAKADAVKFQTFNAQRLAARRKNPDLFLKLKPYEMPMAWLPILKDHADKTGIEFMTTCFDEETLKVVAPFVKRFKIGHGESADKEFYEAHLPYGKQIIASVCDSKLDGWDDPTSDTRHLFCVDKYPTPVADADLSGIAGAACDGYSDHTRNQSMGGLAVAAGAQIIEVHFRLWETTGDNLDWSVSHDPSALTRYIQFVRQAQLAVYGAASEETKKLERPESAPHTSRPQASEASDPSGGRQEAAS